MSVPLTIAQLRRVAEIGRELQARAVMASARSNLYSFMEAKKPAKWSQSNWHHKVIADVTQRFFEGDERYKRTIVTMPPRHGKTQTCSLDGVAFGLGINPDAKVMAASYSASLASANNRLLQRIIETKLYADVFPETRINSRNVVTDSRQAYVRNQTEFEIIDREGYYLCAGVGGGFTGRGATSIMLDDLIKNIAQAESATYRDAIYNFYANDMITRLEDDGGIMMIATRWHDDDHIGRVLKLAAEDPEADQWTVIELPVIADERCPNEFDPRQPGEVLWPSRFLTRLERATLSESEAQTVARRKLDRLQRTVGERSWASLWMAKPNTGAGQIFKLSWFDSALFDRLEGPFRFAGQSWDFTFGGQGESASFVCGGAWVVKGTSAFRIDEDRRQIGFGEMKAAVREMSRKYPATARNIVIENAAFGGALADDLKAEFPGIKLVQPRGSKSVRALAAAPYFEQGKIGFPRGAKWLGDYRKELFDFSIGGKKNDRVDETSQMIAYLVTHGYLHKSSFLDMMVD